jgi:hypothetical protein
VLHLRWKFFFSNHLLWMLAVVIINSATIPPLYCLFGHIKIEVAYHCIKKN